jgi:hypothetical protein
MQRNGVEMGDDWLVLSLLALGIKKLLQNFFKIVFLNLFYDLVFNLISTNKENNN